jgi:selenocysteine lyase/cysteine desulfurase
MKTRRDFLKGVGTVGMTAAAFRPDAISRAAGAGRELGQVSPNDVAHDEDYWSQIQRSFDIDRSRINFNNGHVSPCATHVLDQMIRDLKFSNEMPGYHMYGLLEPRIESVRRDLAKDFGCDTEEMAITRNASEGMETLILGIDLKRGDEVIVTDHNYGRMLLTWEQRARREGIVIKKISFTVPLPSTAHFVDQVKKAITPRTRVIEFPHITNLTGQILPVREVVEATRPLGIEVFVDGAHAYGHFRFSRDELGCDYYATSLHKWLLAPVGTGFLYVRKDKIKTIWPLMAAGADQEGNIRKYEEIGTHPAANHNAINAALAFHQSIGVERKASRLRYLRNRWAKPLAASSDRVKIWTNLNDDSASCGIALVDIEGVDLTKLQAHLLERHGIHTVVIPHKDFRGLRITPGIYTTIQEVDVFAEAMMKVAAKGVVS